MENVTVNGGNFGDGVAVGPGQRVRRVRAELVGVSVIGAMMGALLAGSVLGVTRAAETTRRESREARESVADNGVVAVSQETDPEDTGDGVMDELDDTPPGVPGLTGLTGAVVEREREVNRAAVTPSRARVRMVTSDDVPDGPTQGYDHGRAVRVVVTRLDGKPVEIRTAAAFRRMRAAAQRDRVVIRVVSGFRTMEHQRALYRAYRRGQGNLAAVPGYSNHQSGRAVDLNTSTPGVRRWLERHARRYGFRRTVPTEPWHWEFR